MRLAVRVAVLAAIGACVGGCGLGISQLPEVWDRAGDPYATGHMEMQIKQAIFCELRAGAIAARDVNKVRNDYNDKDVTNPDDIPLPDTWGAQVTLTLTVDEKSNLTPGVSLKNPINPAMSFGSSVAQSFTYGIGGQASSQGVRYDKFNFYYTVADLINNAGPDDSCHHPPPFMGPQSSSSPFVDGRQLGVREWLPQAIGVTIFQRSSRADPSGEGPALGSGGSFTSDAITYDNKFVIITSANFAPTWSLLRVGTPATPLIDFNRTRTHELLITVGPGETKIVGKGKKKQLVATRQPGAASFNAHLASEIGSAVSAAIGNR